MQAKTLEKRGGRKREFSPDTADIPEPLQDLLVDEASVLRVLKIRPDDELTEVDLRRAARVSGRV